MVFIVQRSHTGTKVQKKCYPDTRGNVYVHALLVSCSGSAARTEKIETGGTSWHTLVYSSSGPPLRRQPHLSRTLCNGYRLFDRQAPSGIAPEVGSTAEKVRNTDVHDLCLPAPQQETGCMIDCRSSIKSQCQSSRAARIFLRFGDTDKHAETRAITQNNATGGWDNCVV